MEKYLILRYVLEFSMIIPAVIFAVLPVLEDLRFKSLTAKITGVISIAFFILLGAFLRVKFMLSAIFIIIPYAVLFFILYIILVEASPGRKLFCFFNSVMLCTFCPLYTVFLMAPIEKENAFWYTKGVFTVESSVVYILLALVIGAIFFKTLYVKLPMLMKQEYIGSIWDFLFLVPMFMTVLMWWSIPIHPDLAMAGRLRPVALIILWLMLMMILLLYHVFWWTAMKISDGAKLQQENTLLTMESKRYEELKIYLDETRTLRHDFRQHLLVISQLSNSENFTELKNYLAGFNDGTFGTYTGFCDNIAIDAAASYYNSAAESQGTKINWKLNLPHNLPIKESEYCVILGNLLENALKAVKNLPPENRKINVIAAFRNDNRNFNR